MPKDSNYFEEAMHPCSDNDSNVSSIAETLYQTMLVESLNNKIVPLNGFNILYFLQTAIRAWFSQHSSVLLVSEKCPYACQPIQVTNWSGSPDSVIRQMDIVCQFIELVNTDSVVFGDPFDLQYAVRILKLTFDESGNLRDPVHSKIETAADFDFWLSGFNANEPVPPERDQG